MLSAAPKKRLRRFDRFSRVTTTYGNERLTVFLEKFANRTNVREMKKDTKDLQHICIDTSSFDHRHVDGLVASSTAQNVYLKVTTVAPYVPRIEADILRKCKLEALWLFARGDISSFFYVGALFERFDPVNELTYSVNFFGPSAITPQHWRSRKRQDFDILPSGATMLSISNRPQHYIRIECLTQTGIDVFVRYVLFSEKKIFSFFKKKFLNL